MARPSTSGYQYLTVRADSGKYTYWRSLNPSIAAYVVGDLRLSWTVSDAVLNGKATVKVSLKTGDETTARNRWSEVHSQVEGLIAEATRRARRTVDASGKGLKKVANLTTEERAALAGQSRHDLLAEHDEEWADPNYLSSPIARGLQEALKARVNGAALPESFRTFLEKYPDGLSEDEIRAAARDLEAGAIGQSLKAASTFPVDGVRLTIYEETPAKNGQIELEQIGFVPSETDRRLTENGVEFAGGDIDRRKTALSILQGKAAAFSDIAERDQGKIVETPPRPSLIVVPVEADRFPTLRELHDEWVRLKRPGQKATDDNKLYVDRFIAMHGDLPVNEIKRRHCREYRNNLEKYPRGMTAKMRAMSHPDLMVFMDKANHPTVTVETLSRVTINDKALAAISTLLTIAVQEHDLDANPCTGLRFIIRQGDQIERLPFSLEDLQRLFASPVYQNPPKISSGGGGAAAFWMPLISLFSGAREEEIGQLLTSDIKEVIGIPHIHLTVDDAEEPAKPSRRRKRTGQPEEGEKKFKTENAKRMIPIHRILIEIGFLEYVARRRARGDKQLFSDLSAYRGRWTKNWSRWWGRYQQKHVSTMVEKTFHGFRHTFIEAMKWPAQVPREVRKAFVGHAKAAEIELRPETIDKYGHKHAHLGLLNEWMQKIEYPGLDISHLAAVAKLID